MRFSDTAREALIEAKEKFGSYKYYESSPNEVMNVGALVKNLKDIPIEDAAAELLHLAQRSDCPLDPACLVRSILVDVDDQENFKSLFDHSELVKYYNYRRNN